MLRVVLFCLVFVAAIGFFIRNSIRLVKILSIGRKEDRFRNVRARVKNVLIVAFGQSKLLREPLAGLMHFFIFWGFVILLTAVVEAIIEGLFPSFTMESLGPLFRPLALLQELIGLLVIVSVIGGLVRWYLVRPRRYYGPEIAAHVRVD